MLLAGCTQPIVEPPAGDPPAVPFYAEMQETIEMRASHPCPPSRFCFSGEITGPAVRLPNATTWNGTIIVTWSPANPSASTLSVDVLPISRENGQSEPIATAVGQSPLEIPLNPSAVEGLDRVYFFSVASPGGVLRDQSITYNLTVDLQAN